VTSAAPALAKAIQGRFEATGLGILATLRADGSPRVSGIEPLFAVGELWIGSMPNSRKGADLGRDGRFALHSATEDQNVTHGDAKITGLAVTVDDAATYARFKQAWKDQSGTDVPEPFTLFRVEVTELAMISLDGDHLAIDSW
nr:pyridoxamine 5'-phosphate oxidase family protein [Micromonospora sp. DSM 115978]